MTANEVALAEGFCTECGHALSEGFCPGGHGERASAPPATTVFFPEGQAPLTKASAAEANDDLGSATGRRHSPWPRRLLHGAAGLAIALLVAAVVLLGLEARSLQHDLGDLRSLQATARADADRQAAVLSMSLGQQNTQLTLALNALSQRLSQLESTVNSRPDPATTARRVAPSVFEVDAGAVLGTAWVIHSAGGGSDLVTNYHVVSALYEGGSHRVNVVQGTSTFPGTITTVDRNADLAIISVAQTFPVLTIALGTPAVGDPVLVIGSSVGLEGTVSTGIVSALRSDPSGRNYIQFSAPISPGNSGGPVVDGAGKVIGVTELKVEVQGAEGLGFAIPVDVVCRTVTTC